MNWQLFFACWFYCIMSYQAYPGPCCQWDTQHHKDLAIRCQKKSEQNTVICNWRRNFCNVSDISQRFCNCGLGQNFKSFFVHVSQLFHSLERKRKPFLQPLLWCNISEPKISWFVCLFILWFCNRIVPWDTVSSHQGCPGKQPKQSDHHYPHSSACTGEHTPHRPGPETRHIWITATSWVRVLGMASRGGHTGKRGF